MGLCRVVIEFCYFFSSGSVCQNCQFITFPTFTQFIHSIKSYISFTAVCVWHKSGRAAILASVSVQLSSEMDKNKWPQSRWHDAWCKASQYLYLPAAISFLCTIVLIVSNYQSVEILWWKSRIMPLAQYIFFIRIPYKQERAVHRGRWSNVHLHIHAQKNCFSVNP